MGVADVPGERPDLPPDVWHGDDFPMRAARHWADDTEAIPCLATRADRPALAIHVNADRQGIRPDRALASPRAKQYVKH